MTNNGLGLGKEYEIQSTIENCDEGFKRMRIEISRIKEIFRDMRNEIVSVVNRREQSIKLPVSDTEVYSVILDVYLGDKKAFDHWFIFKIGEFVDKEWIDREVEKRIKSFTSKLNNETLVSISRVGSVCHGERMRYSGEHTFYEDILYPSFDDEMPIVDTSRCKGIVELSDTGIPGSRPIVRKSKYDHKK